LAISLVLSTFASARIALAIDRTSQARGPIDAVLVDDWRLAVANRNSGSISLIDLRQKTVLLETAVCNAPMDIERAGDDRLLVLDHANHCAVVCRIQPTEFSVEARLPLKPFPIDATVSRDGTWFAATSLWSRQLSICPLDGRPDATVSIALPFAPRCVLLVEDLNRIVIADAFGGKLAVLRFASGPSSGPPTSLAVESIREVPGHNIRHLAVNGSGARRRLQFTQMIASGLAEPRQDEIHWGTYITSGLRSVAFASLMNPDARLTADSRLMTIGDVRHGSADPGGFVVDRTGRSWIAITGTDEIVILDHVGNHLARVAVGEGPATIVQLDSTHFVSINQFSDDLSFVSVSPDSDGSDYARTETLSLGPRPERSAAELGEALFHSAKLSHDGWMSCHSCHTDGHSCGLIVDTLGDGAVGAPKRVLSLRGVAGTEPLAWTGGMDFESQIRKSVLQTMHGVPITRVQITSLTAYLKSLKPLPTRSQLGDGTTVGSLVGRGRQHFDSFGCSKCHQGESKTSSQTYDVGVADSLGNRRFNPPSLRGVLHRDRLLHDGRANSLEDLLTRHHHPKKHTMADRELEELIIYLNSL
jgi:hypothetical protein